MLDDVFIEEKKSIFDGSVYFTGLLITEEYNNLVHFFIFYSIESHKNMLSFAIFNIYGLKV